MDNLVPLRTRIPGENLEDIPLRTLRTKHHQRFLIDRPYADSDMRLDWDSGYGPTRIRVDIPLIGSIY